MLTSFETTTLTTICPVVAAVTVLNDEKGERKETISEDLTLFVVSIANGENSTYDNPIKRIERKDIDATLFNNTLLKISFIINIIFLF